MIDERHEETAALYALDLLEPAERSAFEAQLAADPVLANHVRELRESANTLALLAPTQAPSAALRARILSTVGQSAKTARPTGRTITAAPTAAAAPAQIIRFPFSAWMGWAAAAAFAIVSALLGQRLLTQRTELISLRQAQELAQLELRSLQTLQESERIVTARQIEELRRAEAQVASLSTTLSAERTESTLRVAELQRRNDLAQLKIASLAALAGASPDAKAIAVWNPTTQEGVLTVEKLPALAANQDYQLWVIDPQYPIPVDGGVFTVDPDTGAARMQFKPDKPVKVAAKFAVSLERKGGVPKAEGPLLLIGGP